MSGASQGTKAIDAAIARYRDELCAEADLGKRELAEIENHLRDLCDELVADGLPAAEAVATAARRMGEPREVARQYAEVHPSLGARISRVRAWSAVALIVPALFTLAPHWSSTTQVITVILVGGLLARQAWARIALLTIATFKVVSSIHVFFFVISWKALAFWLTDLPWYVVIDLVIPIGVVAMLAPWKRRELSVRGLALAALVWLWLVAGALAVEPAWMDLTPWSAVAQSGALIGILGFALRAHWTPAPIIVAAVALLVETSRVVDTSLFGMSFTSRPFLTSLAITGLLAAPAAVVITWRSARRAASPSNWSVA